MAYLDIYESKIENVPIYTCSGCHNEFIFGDNDPKIKVEHPSYCPICGELIDFIEDWRECQEVM